MRQFFGLFPAIALIILLPLVALAEPQPMAITGAFEEGGLIRVFGKTFGEVPDTAFLAGEQGAGDLRVSGVMVGDMPTLEKCTFSKWMLLESWTPTEVQFLFSGEGLVPLQKFYFFIVDAQGNASTGVGPWMEGRGILDSNNRIDLEMENSILRPTGAPRPVTGPERRRRS